MSMFKALLESALRGLVHELAIKPRDLRVYAILDTEETLLAKIDAVTIRDILRKRARGRTLRFKLGHAMFDVPLGSNRGGDEGSSPRQRGQ